jgi:hypothetical protein
MQVYSVGGTAFTGRCEMLDKNPYEFANIRLVVILLLRKGAACSFASLSCSCLGASPVRALFLFDALWRSLAMLNPRFIDVTARQRTRWNRC